MLIDISEKGINRFHQKTKISITSIKWFLSYMYIQNTLEPLGSKQKTGFSRPTKMRVETRRLMYSWQIDFLT